jgi:predicted amidophosphoribosyltransferase
MAVKTLGYFLDRLKHSLRNHVCSICQVSPQSNASESLICEPCERRILLRKSVPVVMLRDGPLYAACELSYRMKQLIYGLKFHQKSQNGMVLSDVLIHYWAQLSYASKKGWVVVPVPPHHNTEVVHLPLMARPFASYFGYDFLENGLVWQHPVRPQHKLLNKRKRRENLLGALKVNPAVLTRLDKPSTKILVVDDLLTTGATLAEATAAFKQALPEASVVALAVSHVPLALNRHQLKGEL